MNKLSIRSYEVQELTFHQDAVFSVAAQKNKILVVINVDPINMIVEFILIHPLGLSNQFVNGLGKVQYCTAEYSKQV